jgi:GT2 family glycosyltransferase
MDEPRVSVVIPTFNRADLVLECLASLERQQVPMEIIVVDDGSTDGTGEQITAAHPRVRVPRLERNSGFAIATNTGIRAARAEWVLLLNNDVTLAEDCIARMLAAAAREHADMVAPLILWRDSPEQIYSRGDRVRRNGRPGAIGFRESLRAGISSEEPFGVSAACGLYHRRVFDTVGLLAEDFVAYFEDADLCFRARLAGLRAAVAGDAVAWHIGSASIAGNTWWRSAQCYRNHALLVLRNMPWPLLWKYRRVLRAERRHQFRMMFNAARAKFGAVRAVMLSLRYTAWLLLSLPRAILQRRHIQRLRSVSLEDLDTLLRD